MDYEIKPGNQFTVPFENWRGAEDITGRRGFTYYEDERKHECEILQPGGVNAGDYTAKIVAKYSEPILRLTQHCEVGSTPSRLSQVLEELNAVPI